MNILLTGATGYIGKRLLPVLVRSGHHVVCSVRDKNRFKVPQSLVSNTSIIEVDYLDEATLDRVPKDIDMAFYLMHSMSTSEDYQQLELHTAQNFNASLKDSNIQHVVYLSGIVNQEELSPHLQSRYAVEQILALGPFHLTTFRAGIIIGSGSASFEIIRDLIEKLPLMIAPKWLNTRSQPIGIQTEINEPSKVNQVEQIEVSTSLNGDQEILIGENHRLGR